MTTGVSPRVRKSAGFTNVGLKRISIMCGMMEFILASEFEYERIRELFTLADSGGKIIGELAVMLIFSTSVNSVNTTLS